MDQRYNLTLKKHTGMLVASRQITYKAQGTYDECIAAYKKAQLHNLAFGWWSIFSIIYNPLAMLFNYRAKRKLDELAGKK